MLITGGVHSGEYVGIQACGTGSGASAGKNGWNDRDFKGLKPSCF